MKRAEKYALARLMVKWGYYGRSDDAVLDPAFSVVNSTVVLLFNDILEVIQISRTEIDSIAFKVMEVEKNG